MSLTELKNEAPLAESADQAPAQNDQASAASADDSTASAAQPEAQCVASPKEMTPWEIVKMARDRARPQPLELCTRLFTDFFELHGDRRFADDSAIRGGFAYFDGQPVMLLATHKGRTMDERRATHCGSAMPEGYRKALRLMRLADKAGCPIITFVDTAGAYPGIDSENRHIGEAIAFNLQEMFRFTVPIVAIITGEGGSGGALGLAVANRVLMLANAYYSVITPEGCASILWKNAEKAPEATEALRLTAPDLLKMGVIDTIIPEPDGGAQTDYNATAENIKNELRQVLPKLRRKSGRKLRDERYDRFRKFGKFTEQ